MDHYRIAIHGFGMLPPLLALHLLVADADANVLLLCGDAQVGGDQVEPVIAGKLQPAARDLAEMCCVSRWEGYYIARDNAVERFDEPVWLLDPVQVWLELAEHSARCTAISGCGQPGASGAQLTWAGGGTALADRFVDLSVLTATRAECEILGIDQVRRLSLPILADYDTAAPGWEANQLLPLGDDRVLVRKLPLRTGLVAANSTFESLLNALVAD